MSHSNTIQASAMQARDPMQTDVANHAVEAVNRNHQPASTPKSGDELLVRVGGGAVGGAFIGAAFGGGVVGAAVGAALGAGSVAALGLLRRDDE